MSDWRVMVVEDDRVVARLHCRFLARVPGFDVVGVAATGAQADQMIATLKPDLLLLDLGLPDETGSRSCAGSARAASRSRRLPSPPQPRVGTFAPASISGWSTTS